MVTGVIIHHFGLMNLELKLDLMELEMMVFSGWTSTISKISLDSGLSTSILIMQSSTTLRCTVAIRQSVNSVIVTKSQSII